MLNCMPQQLSEEAVSLHVCFRKDLQTEKSVKERLVKINHTTNKGIEQTMFFSLHYMVINTRITLDLTIYNLLYWFPPLPLTLLSGDQHKLIRYWDNWYVSAPPFPHLHLLFSARSSPRARVKWPGARVNQPQGRVSLPQASQGQPADRKGSSGHSRG